MGKRFFQSYRWVLLSMLVTILVLAAAAGYTIGVVSKNQAVSQIDVNIGSVEAYLQKNENQASQLTEELKEDYISKTHSLRGRIVSDGRPDAGGAACDRQRRPHQRFG